MALPERCGRLSCSGYQFTIGSRSKDADEIASWRFGTWFVTALASLDPPLRLTHEEQAWFREFVNTRWGGSLYMKGYLDSLLDVIKIITEDKDVRCTEDSLAAAAA